MSLIGLSPFRTIFFGISFLIIMRMKLGINDNLKHIIKGIHLKDDGKNCIIETRLNKFEVNNRLIRKLNMEEALFFNNHILPIYIN